jgi:NitT/TauT family transport system permease protein
MRGSTTKGHRPLWAGAGILFSLLVWYGLSAVYHQLIVPTPAATWESLRSLAESGKLWDNLTITIQRLFLGLMIGSMLGLACGVLAGIFEGFYYFIKPMLILVFSSPPVVIVVLAMLWFGMGSAQTVFVVSILVFPTVFINTFEGMLAIDQQLLEMADIYRASNAVKWFDIYLPALSAPILSGLTLAAGMAIRIAVMAELLGTSDGIGYAIAIARTNLDTPQLFAWILVCLALVAAMELLLIKPTRKYLLRWQTE